MSRTSETKNKILKMLESGDMRLIDICPELGLSAPTVSQHLKELRVMRLIEEAPDQHFKNEKYYRLATKRAISAGIIQRQMPKYVIGVIALAVIASSLLFYGMIVGAPVFKQGSSQGMLNILLTDPPHVPAGTQSLNITYSGIQLHVVNKSVDEWISINSTGSVDLLNLINVSRLIASAQVPSNAVINAATFNITKASITIDNSTYPVYLQNRKISTSVSDSLAFNGSSSLLLDFSPTVIPTYMNGTAGFAMLPSITAAMIAKHAMLVRPNVVHWQITLNKNVLMRLRMSGGVINITSENVSSAGNATRISISVKDNSNRSITLEHVLVLGPIPGNTTTYGTQAAHITWLARAGPYPIDFAVSGNGTLVQSHDEISQSAAQTGLAVAPSQTATLSFGSNVLSTSTQYTVVVIGSDGAYSTYPQQGDVFYWNGK